VSTRLDSSRLVPLARVILVAAALLAYANTLSAPWLFDDERAITRNPTIRQLTALGTVLFPPADGSGVAGRPLVNLSLALNHAVGGDDVRGYHLFNILLHAGAGLLLFGLARRTLARPCFTPHGRAAAPSLAFALALLWTLHPLQTESVTCVIQRTELLVGFFYLATLYAFAGSMENNHPARWRAVCLASCLLGMASKEVMVTAPLIVWLYDRTFVAGSFGRAWRERGRFYLGLGATWVLLALLVAGYGGARGPSAGFGLGVAWWSYALKQCEALVLYVRLAVWPHPLVLDYGTDVITDVAAVWPQLAACVAAALGTALALWRRPVIGFAGAWFFVIIAPSSSVVPLVTQTVSEHRVYLPLLAVLATATVAVFRLGGRRALPALGIAALLLLALTIRRNRDYRSDLAIWTDTAARQPHNARAQMGLGLALFHKGETARGLTHLQRAIALRPNYAEAHYNLGVALAQSGRTDAAIAAYRAALHALPGYVDASYNLAIALLGLSRIDEALALLHEVLRQRPAFAEAHNNLGIGLARLGRLPDAIAAFERSLALNPANAEAHNNLGTCWRHLDRVDDARRHYELAVRLRPDFALARENLARLPPAGGPLR
jgi:Flp pilus assembly protein TadD